MFTATEAREMPTDTLVALFETTIETTSLSIKKNCLILAELDARNALSDQMRTLTKQGTFRWFREIAADKLAPAVAFACGDNYPLIQGLMRLPVPAQENIAAGQEIPVAERIKGEIKEVTKPIWRIDYAEISRVFGDKGVRTIKEQTAMLRAEDAGSISTGLLQEGRIGIDLQKNTLRFGMMKVDVSELTAPLRKLGFRLVRIASKSEAA